MPKTAHKAAVCVLGFRRLDHCAFFSTTNLHAGIVIVFAPGCLGQAVAASGGHRNSARD
jgi:hypothetical protein